MKNTDFYFDVEKVDTKLVMPGYSTNKENKYAIVAYPNDEPKVIDLCSSVYELVPNSELYPKLEELFNSNPNTRDFQSRTYSKDHKHFYKEYRFPKFEGFVGSKKDGIVAGMGLSNSYYGKNFQGNVNVNRLICTNGLWGVVSELSVKHRHTTAVTIEVKRLFDEAIVAIERFSEQVEKYNVLASAKRGIDWEDRLETVAEKNGIVKFHDRAKDILRTESIDLYGGVVNDWLIYNALNQIIHNSDLNKKPIEIRQKIDKKVFEHMVATV